MRPTVRFLSDGLIEQIIAEAIDVLGTLGVEIHNREVLSLLADHGAKVDPERQHVVLPEPVIRQALSAVPSSFRLYDVRGNETHHFAGDAVYFTPGSTALRILDYDTKRMRPPTTTDYVAYAKLIGQLP